MLFVASARDMRACFSQAFSVISNASHGIFGHIPQSEQAVTLSVVFALHPAASAGSPSVT